MCPARNQTPTREKSLGSGMFIFLFFLTPVLSVCQVTFIYIALLTIQIVSKQLQTQSTIKIGTNKATIKIGK